MYNPLDPPSTDFNRAHPPATDIEPIVKAALAEDVGDGDRTAALVDESAHATASVISRESAVLCGAAWFTAVYAELDPAVDLTWLAKDGDYVRPDQELVRLTGPARSILTGERTALNFMQLLSGTATQTRRFVERVKGTKAQIVDTRKTLPGLRTAQKYAVRCGGGVNHRFGLYDAVMVKENHVAAAGGLGAAIHQARMTYAKVPVIAEAESIGDVEEALKCPAPPDILLLDDFETHLLARAVNMVGQHSRHAHNKVLVEASGGIDQGNVRDVADTGVDRISIGGLTKHVNAVDLSMRFGGI
ncbi:carboxylating nicotinate-nucleotide diphosphorylase [Abyssibacter sp.]|mgnify:FL=1|uniref:carboxylating nicotinate-nucleotide diphosphorylase n=1 Tax=Abyssibacter sp. TaxID=2320200 RepID=UPI0025BBC772|nr:carboxylating nicotinate-nucleotide diphosphorylase [Abyssibacter sp.]MCK5860062.1 carboxylating nicotinate-nucleotide diphosphorylase [Abyssibacter sp.]